MTAFLRVGWLTMTTSPKTALRRFEPPGIQSAMLTRDPQVRLVFQGIRRELVVRGPIFRPIDRHANVKPQRLTDQSMALVVKRCAHDAGLDANNYAGHSLRSGLATAAAMADCS